MRWLFVLGIGVQTLLVAAEKPTTLHALLICDTCEPNIQISSHADVNRMEKALQAIGTHTHLQVNTTRLNIDSFGPSTFKRWLHSIKGKKSIAFLYYSGTPRSSRIKTSWPCISFHSCRCRFGQPISQERVAKDIVARKARLSLVIFDCYSKAPTSKESCTTLPSTVIPTDIALPNLNALFLKNTGLIMACSVPLHKKQSPFSHEHADSIHYTDRFLLGLTRIARSSGIAWLNLPHAMFGCGGQCAPEVRKSFKINVHSEVAYHMWKSVPTSQRPYRR